MMCEPKTTTGSSASVWDREAAGYDAARQGDPIYSSCIHHTTRPIVRGTRVCLDAGCGTGLSTVALSRRCETVVAVDYSRESLRILSSRRLPNVILVQADLTALPFKNSEFESCVCANTLQHFRPDGAQLRAVSELKRVTRQSGTLIISVHHYSKSKRKANWVKEGKPGQPGIDYIHRFSRKELHELLPGSAITAVGYYVLLKVPFLGARLQRLMALLLGKAAALLGYGHMLIAVVNEHRAPAAGGRPGSLTKTLR
jgi:SAM-dependent methyltransferase